jgi:2,3,4,5-tetrahydropyridine-2-carboxylate N-succinyltransferase
VHLSGGVGIGGVLEPPGARPVIIEDGAFIGSRAIVVEGVVVERRPCSARAWCSPRARSSST